MNNNRYLFLIAWVEGSDSADGENTKIHDQSDLYTQFMKNNEHVFACEILMPNEDMAYAFGYSKAFFQNYTACDAVSIVHRVDDDVIFSRKIPLVEMNFSSEISVRESP